MRAEPDSETWAALDEDLQRGLRLLVDRMDQDWSLSALTALVYNVPKILLDLSLEAAPMPELKAYQRRFFTAIYQLVPGTDTGPRLPTLFRTCSPQPPDIECPQMGGLAQA